MSAKRKTGIRVTIQHPLELPSQDGRDLNWQQMQRKTVGKYERGLDGRTSTLMSSATISCVSTSFRVMQDIEINKNKCLAEHNLEEKTNK